MELHWVSIHLLFCLMVQTKVASIILCPNLSWVEFYSPKSVALVLCTCHLGIKQQCFLCFENRIQITLISLKTDWMPQACMWISWTDNTCDMIVHSNLFYMTKLHAIYATFSCKQSIKVCFYIFLFSYCNR